MAAHTPVTPAPMNLLTTTANSILNTHMDITPVIMVYLTSPAARSTFGTVNESGHMNTAETQFIMMILTASSAVSSDRPYTLMIYGSARIIAALLMNMAAYTHFISFLV